MTVYYSQKILNETKVAKSRSNSLRIHFKHCREVTRVLRGMKLETAKRYLNGVLRFRQAVPFTRFCRGVGRHAQGKRFGSAQCRWPRKATLAMLEMLQNCEANAAAKKLVKDKLVVSHIQATRAAQSRRRTYRAHGRINSYLKNPAHIECFLEERDEAAGKKHSKHSGSSSAMVQVKGDEK